MSNNGLPSFGFVKSPKGQKHISATHRGLLNELVERANIENKYVIKGRLKGLLVKRGCCLIGLGKLTKITGIYRSKLISILRELQADGKIKKITKAGCYTIYKIEKFDLYQGKIVRKLSTFEKINNLLRIGVNLTGDAPVELELTTKEKELVSEIGGLSEINRALGNPMHRQTIINKLNTGG